MARDMGANMDPELYLRLEGERGLLDLEPGIPTYPAAASALIATGRLSAGTAVRIVEEYATAAAGQSGIFQAVGPPGIVPAQGIGSLRVVACNVVDEADWGRVLYPYVTVTDRSTRVLMIVEGVSKAPRPPGMPMVSIADDMGRTYGASFGGPGFTGNYGPDSFVGYVSTPNAIPESARWMEVNGRRIDLTPGDTQVPIVEVEDLVDGTPAERFLAAVVGSARPTHFAGLADSAARALVATGEIGPDHPLVLQARAATPAPPAPGRTGPVAQFGGRGGVTWAAAGPNMGAYTSIVQSSISRYGTGPDLRAVAIGRIVDGVDGMVFGLEVLIQRPDGFQLTFFADGPQAPAVPGWLGPQAFLRWEAEDDLGHVYTAAPTSWGGAPFEPAEAQLSFSPGLDPDASLLRITVTGVNQVARIVLTIRGAKR